MGIHNICPYEEVGKNYTGCNLKTTELLECALIGACAVIRSNTVCVIALQRQLYRFYLTSMQPMLTHLCRMTLPPKFEMSISYIRGFWLLFIIIVV